MVPILRLDESTMSWRETDDGIVVLNLSTSRYLVVNDTGKFLWDLLLVGATREQLTDRLVEKFDIEAGIADADVGEFIQQLTATGVLVAP